MLKQCFILCLFLFISHTSCANTTEPDLPNPNTEILLIIGHSNCGAIDAVRGQYKHLDLDIVKELDTIHIRPGVSNITGVQQND